MESHLIPSMDSNQKQRPKLSLKWILIEYLENKVVAPFLLILKLLSLRDSESSEET